MAKKISRLQRLRESALALWDESIFRLPDEPTRLHKFIHFWVLVGKSFVRNRCPIRASALSYTTLLALIPMLAVALSVTSSLLKKEGEERISTFIGKFVATVVPPANTTTNHPGRHLKRITPLPSLTETNPEILLNTNAPAFITTTNLPSENITNLLANGTDSIATITNAPAEASDDSRLASAQKTVARQINDFIQNTRSGALGVTGMILLIMVAIRMLSSIEATFNDIWGVTRGRNWYLRIITYWATITLGPLLLASALGFAGGPHFEGTRKLITSMPLVGGLVFPALTLVILWLTFALFYKAVPNTKVHFNAALVGGFVAGTLWHLNNVFGFLYVSRVVTNSKIYGSLGLVPVFMAGIYISWLLLLFGAQVAYAFQNRSLYLQEKLAENVNQRGREFVALRLMTCIGQRFQHGQRAPTVQSMSSELGIPSRLIQQVLQTLIAAHLVIELSGAEPAYTPARPLDDITAHHILQAMRATQGQELVTRNEPVRAEVYGEFARIQEAEKQAASAVSMLALVNRAQARLELAAPTAPDEELKMTPALKPHPANEVETTPVTPIQAAPAESESTKVEVVSHWTEPEPNPLTKPVNHPSTHSIVEPPNDEERDFPL